MTDRIDYITFGWKLPYIIENKYGKIDMWNDKFLPYIEGHKGVEFSIIRDGMSNKYTVFGIIINSDSEGWDFTNIDLNKIDIDKVKSKYLELFGENPSTEPTLFIFSNFY